ncbi:hypothetical protein ID866_3466, partial [Astraeus odoratus]
PPSYAPERPSLQAIQGVGSMRAGTQTLIQALQALPWVDDPDNEDDLGPTVLPNVDSDDDSKAHIASSIHAIYRPVAWSKHGASSHSVRSSGHPAEDVTRIESDSDVDMNMALEDEADVDDFEAATPRPVDAEKPESLLNTAPPTVAAHLGATFKRRPASRSGSLTTVKVDRRVRLAEKLREIFEIDTLTEVWAGKDALLAVKICLLSKKATRTKRWIKYWFVLKNDALSWYQSSSDPYFLNGIIDLRYAVSCDPVGEKDMQIRTNQKNVALSADSIPSREEWVKAIRKVMFKAQNMGDTVKIAIPYSVILDVEKSSAMDFSETIEVKVDDKDGTVDPYFFAYFRDIQAALDHIRDAVRTYRTLTPASPQALLDTTTFKQFASGVGIDRTRSLSAADSKGGSSFRLSAFLRPFQESLPLPLGRMYSAPEPPNSAEEYTHISKRGTFVPVASPSYPYTGNDVALSRSPTSVLTTEFSSHLHDHTYPPSSPTEATSSFPGKILPSGVPWNVGVPSWLRSGRKGTSSSAPASSTSASLLASQNLEGVREIYSSPDHTVGASTDLGYSVLETADAVVDAEIAEKFRTAFAFDEREILLAYFSGYLYRVLPVYGRLYVSTSYFCFKSSGPLTLKTKMILPIRDILNVEKSRATRFGHYGLTVVIKGHEELFFEFSVEDRRTAFISILQRQVEEIRKRPSSVDIPKLSQGQRDALILEEFEPRRSSSGGVDPAPLSEAMSESLPAVMFTSASSTFLTFKPKESLHFTFLTVGSRGDVQPYIALAKGLIADGHRCKIATHKEFQTWIEAHGIEYGYVGGDPAELMRICVENGTFTVAFLKEGLLKACFRGWLDDLLKTSWEACQGTDVLVECPSAMGGYHIAEALRIPYFRAFTMTWTRTRAYPHAFAVPERKMGGGYNYMTYVLFDQVFWRATSGQINRWRRNVLHLDNTSLDRMEPHKIPFLYNFSPTVVPPPLDWPEWIRVTGYWFLDDAQVGSNKWTPPDDLVSFIDSAHHAGKKVVYIGFGSIVVSDPRGMTRCVIEAVVQSGVYAILSKGWSDRLHTKTSEACEPEEPLPKQIYPIASIPHDWLFQRVDAACHHGGAGTTGASLRAGIPTIIKPFFGDQFFWADRVEALGIGAGVRKLTVDNLKEALIIATTDQKQIDRAKLIGEQIRSENGIATGIECIYRDLDYARSLIKRPPEVVEEAEDGPSVSDDAGSRSRYDSVGSQRGSEDWSVISDLEDRRSSFGSRRSDGKLDPSSSFKRTSLAAAMMSVLPDALTSPTHRRPNSLSS